MNKNHETGTPDVPDNKQAYDSPKSNFDLLLTHLDRGSLAAKLVEAYVAPGENTREDAMAEVIRKRTDELKSTHDRAEDQSN